MYIHCLQTHPAFGETEANLDGAERLLASMEEPPDLVVLPELFASGYTFESAVQARALAEPVPDGPTVRRLAAWARQTGATFVAGLPELDGDDVFNAAVVVTPKGWLGTYRKTHLFYEETLHFTPGDSGFQVWTVTDRAGTAYRLGVMICFDWFFPESARTLALGGADVIAHPSNLVLPHCPRSMPVRALENGVFTATANRVGTEANSRGAHTFIGQSVICSPQAEVLAAAPVDEVAVIATKTNPTEARNRNLNPYNDRLASRRPGLYTA